MKVLQSWVASLDQKYDWSSGMQDYLACGRTKLQREIKLARDCMWRASLVMEHSMMLFSRLQRMAKEIEGLRVETGMFYGWIAHGHPRIMGRCRWPYAAVAMFDGRYLRCGSVIVPCAGAAPRNKSHAPVLTCLRHGWAPVTVPMQGKRLDSNHRVSTTPDQIARQCDVRQGDAYLWDMTYERSPILYPTQQGVQCRAVSFGGIEEIIDEARARVVFDLLPSA